MKQPRDASGRWLGTVYLIHFSVPYRHARHYTGWTTDLEYRVSEHRKGKGSRLLQVCLSNHIEWEISRVWWDVPREKERRVKRQRKSQCCLLCRMQNGQTIERWRKYRAREWRINRKVPTRFRLSKSA